MTHKQSRNWENMIVFLGPRSEYWGPDSRLVCGRFTTRRLWKCRSMQIWRLKKNKPTLSLKLSCHSRQVDVWAHLRGYLWSVLVVLYRYEVGVVTYRTRISQRIWIFEGTLYNKYHSSIKADEGSYSNHSSRMWRKLCLLIGLWSLLLLSSRCKNPSPLMPCPLLLFKW